MVIFTDPWNGKHDATIKDVNPENQHATLEISAMPDVDDAHAQKWFQDRACTFENVPSHAEGAPYSYKEQE